MAAGDSRAIASRRASRRANRESRSRVARARSVAFFTHPRDARPRSRARYCGRARATARGDVEEMGASIRGRRCCKIAQVENRRVNFNHTVYPYDSPLSHERSLKPHSSCSERVKIPLFPRPSTREVE